MKKEIIYLGADHAGFELKESIKAHLMRSGYTVYDLGAHLLDKHDDYPDFAFRVSDAVSDNPESFGILCCGSAQGMCIAANKHKGIRAVSVTSVKEAKITRSHNNANVLCLAGWSISKFKAIDITNAWISTPFSQHPRHVRRLKKIARMER